MLFKWDSLVRKHFCRFEADKTYQATGIESLYTNPTTSFRDPVQFGHRYAKLETLRLRQQLGEVTSAEVRELNQVFSGSYSISRGFGGQLNGTNRSFLGATWLGCTGLAAFAKVSKGYNIVWLVGSYVPLWTAILYTQVKQPTQLLHNCYCYLIAKREASVALHDGYASFGKNSFTSSSEFKTLKSQLTTSNKTLYELESEIVNAIAENRF